MFPVHSSAIHLPYQEGLTCMHEIIDKGESIRLLFRIFQRIILAKLYDEALPRFEGQDHFSWFAVFERQVLKALPVFRVLL